MAKSGKKQCGSPAKGTTGWDAFTSSISRGKAQSPLAPTKILNVTKKK